MQLGRRAQILLIIAVGLVVYYPVIFAEFCTVDDVVMVEAYQAVHSWSLKGLFIPGSGAGLYYRPLIAASFLVDRFLLQLDPVWLHLHNVALHLLNALLVYWLSLSLLRFKQAKMEWLPLTTALVFCLHPIVTESVDWISGRTDLLAAAFVLSSAVVLLRFRTSRRNGWLVLSLGLFLLGTLSKEVSLAFLPGWLLILTAKEGDAESETSVRFRQYRVFLLAGIATMLLFFLLRSLAFTANVGRIGMTLISIRNSPGHAVGVILGAFGFYMKKVVIPLPLSFAIVEVDPLYQLLALPLIVFCAYLLSRRSLPSALYLAGVFLIAPSFLIAFNQIAWTPFAERYVYLPTAFMTVSLLFYLGERLAARPQLVRLLVIVLLPVMAATTMARNITWHSNYALFKDTAEKSPDFPEMHLLYASKLIEHREFDSALVQAKQASANSNFGFDERAELYVADILLLQGKTDEAIGVTERVLKKQKERSIAALQHLVSLWQHKVQQAAVGTGESFCNGKLLESYRRLYAQTKDSSLLYRMGGVSLALRHTADARGYFQRTLDSSTADGTLKRLAGKALARLGER